jgi:hypothetical protein
VTPEQISVVEASLLSARFLGCATRVAPKLAAILAKVEAALRAEHASAMAALPVGVPAPTFSGWHGITGVGGYRKAAGYHGHGLAIDLNVPTNGYAVCRTVVGGRTILGGERAGAQLPHVRARFFEACERACAAGGVPCDLSARYAGESTGALWDRWHAVSEAVRAYLAPYYETTDAIDQGAADARPGVAIPAQVAADYEALRVPLVVGGPSLHPATMRNPARCLMDIPRAVAVALCDVGGLRWGACDFGPAESGDLMHFDTASRIPSGA